MGLLNGGMASVFGRVFNGVYLDGQLFPVTTEKVSGGSLTETVGEPIDCKYQPEAVTQKMREREGYTDRDARFFVLQSSVDGGPPVTGWELTTDTGRWSIAHVDQDPARAYWDLHVRPAKGRQGG